MMKTAKALVRKDKYIIDPEIGEPMKIMLWPGTKQLKEIPIPQHFHDGYLDNMEFWAFDDETATTAIKFKGKEEVLRLVSAKDLLRFRERERFTLCLVIKLCAGERLWRLPQKNSHEWLPQFSMKGFGWDQRENLI